MKNFESQLDSSSLFSLENPQFELNYLCQKGNEAIEYCINETCKTTHTFICGIKKCPCRKNHKQCLKADIEYTIHKIKSKIINPKQITQNLSIQFDHLIDNLSDFRDQLIEKLNSLSPHLNMTRLYQVEKDFLLTITKHSDLRFTPIQTAKLWNSLNGKYAPNYDIFTQITSQIDKFKEFISNQQKSTQNKIKHIIEKQQVLNQSQNAKLSIEAAFKLDSSILVEDQLIQRLKAMFKRNIDEVKILYKASQHDFSVPKYYEICGDKTYTMLVCKTNMDKIIGGFTPLKFGSDSNEKIRGFIGDNSGQSFIFNLTENDKFQLERKYQAIYRDPNKMELTYGNVDLELCDRAHKVTKSSTFLRNKAYINSKYEDNEESFLKLNGNKDLHFTTKEWQIWKISFDEKDEQIMKQQQEQQNDFGLMGLFNL